MDNKLITGGILGLIVGLIGGFLIANAFNRTEINSLRASSVQSPSVAGNSKSKADGFSISDDELKAKIAEADENPENFSYQKNLGSALYRYATMKNDPALIAESARILARANKLDETDYDVLVDLGNAYFDVGGFNRDNASFQKAREVYMKALATKPDDAAVRSDLAITYFLSEPKDFNKAVEEFQKAIKSDPKQQRALQYLTQTYIQQGKFDDAAKSLAQLRSANPTNDSIQRLESQITSKQAANTE